ncbi:MAG: GAF domain-containing protein [Chloroflexi bacterium]|nr:GAF domain-containing protein [Chloroflexota bacterium]
MITVIKLFSKKPDAYDFRHAALGDRIASHIAGPIANAELHAATASLANEVGLLAEIGRFAGDLRDLDSALDSVFDLSQRLLPASRAAVSVIDSETQRIDTVARIGRRLPKAGQIQIDDGIKSVIQDVMKSGEPRVIDNAMIQSASNDSELAKAYRDLGFQSILIVPLIAHGSPIGFITWWSEKDRAFDGNGVRLGERIAAQLAGPIANWDATRKLKSVALERQLIADVGTAFSKYPEFQDAFDASVKLLAEHFPITRAFVSQVNQTTGTATVISLFGLESDDTRVGIEYPLTGSNHELALEGSGVLVSDDSNVEALSSNVPNLTRGIKNSLVSHVTVPLISEGTVIGTLGISSDVHNAYSAQDGAVMARIGAIVSGALAKSLLSEKIKRQGDELRVLGEISKEVTRSLDLKIVMERIDHSLRKIVEYRWLSLDVIDPEQEFITAIYRASEGEVEIVEGAAIPLSETIAGSAIIQGLPVVVDVEPGNAIIDRYPGIRSAVHDGVRSILALPVMSNGRPVASLMLVADKVNAFGSAESLLLSKVAAQIGGAISNALLAADVARDSEQRQILAEIGRVVTASPSVEDTYERFAELALSLIPADRLVLAYKNDELGTIQNVFVAGTHIAGQEAGSVHGMDSGLSSLILKLRQPVCVNSNEQAKLFDSELMQSALESGLRSFLAIPMIWNGNVIGTINFRSRNPAAFHARDILIGEQIAAQISGAIVNSRMADRERRHAEEVQSLAQLGELLSRSPDLDDSLNAGAELISGLLRSDRLQVFDVQSNGDIANLLFNWAKNGRTGRTNAQKPTRGSLFEWVIANAAPVALDHDTSKEILELNLTLPSLRYYRSHLFLPLFSGEQVVGLLVSSSHDPRRISSRQLQIGREVATHISNLMVNAARFRELKREADTRRLIASVSHSVSQDLELTAVVQRLAAELSHILAFDRFEVVLLDQDERAMTLVYEEGVGAGNTALGRPVKIPLDDDCWHDFADYATDPWAWGSKLIGKNGALSTLIPGQDLTGLGSLVMAPLGAPQSWVLGFIALRTVQENAYTDQDLELLQLIAGQVTPAIRNAQTHEQAIRLAQIEAEAGELIRMNRLKSKFLSTVSHELRTPLTAMLAFTDILSRNRARNLTDSQLGQLDVIRKSGRRLNLLIEDLLDVSRIDMDQLNLEVYEFSWKDALRDITSSFAPLLDAKHQSLHLDSSSPDIWIRADRGRIVQVVSNLLTNASKYSPDGATIRLRWNCDGESLLFDVQDDGIGIAESDQQQLFTPFFRVDNEATRSQPGTGLGLVIVKSIIELHGGTIDVSSELGRGTTFSVRFPGVLPGPSEEWLRQRDALDLEPVPHSRLDVV